MTFLAAMLFIATSGLIGWHHEAIRQKLLPRSRQQVRLSITLIFSTGDRQTYSYMGTCDEMMEMLNHAPMVGSRWGEQEVAAWDSDIRELSEN